MLIPAHSSLWETFCLDDIGEDGTPDKSSERKDAADIAHNEFVGLRARVIDQQSGLIGHGPGCINQNRTTVRSLPGPGELCELPVGQKKGPWLREGDDTIG